MKILTRNKRFQRRNRGRIAVKSESGDTVVVDNKTTLDLNSEFGLRFNDSMVCSQWQDASKGKIFIPNTANYESAGIDNIIHKNAGVGLDGETNAFFTFNDSNDDLMIGGGETAIAEIFIVNIDTAALTTKRKLYFTRGIATNESDITNYSFIFNLRKSGTQLEAGFRNWSASGSTIVNVFKEIADLKNNTLKVSVIWQGGTLITLLDNVVANIGTYNTPYNTQKGVHVCGIGQGFTDGTCLDEAQIHRVLFQKGTSFPVSGKIVGDFIPTNNIDYLPISRHKDESNTIYLSTFNKTTIDQNDIIITDIDVWRSETNNDSFDGNTTALQFKKDGVRLASFAKSTNTYAIGTSDFHFEAWVQFEALSTTQTILSESTHTKLELRLAFDDNIELLISGSQNIITTGVSLSVNTWYHITCIRANGITAIFLDGILLVQGTDTTDITGANGVEFGGATVQKMENIYFGIPFINIAGVQEDDQGFIPASRKSNVTPKNIQFADQLNASDTVIALSTKNNLTLTGSDVDSWVSYFGAHDLAQSTTSLKPSFVANEGIIFDGIDDELSVADNIAFSPQGVDFLVDFWIKAPSTIDDNLFRWIFGKWDNTTTANREFQFYWDAKFGNQVVFAVSDGSGFQIAASIFPNFTANKWYHIQGVKLSRRNGTQTRVLFIQDGKVIDINDFSGTYIIPNGPSSLIIGNAPNNIQDQFNSTIDSIRLVINNNGTLTRYLNALDSVSVNDKLFTPKQKRSNR